MKPNRTSIRLTRALRPFSAIALALGLASPSLQASEKLMGQSPVLAPVSQHDERAGAGDLLSADLYSESLYSGSADLYSSMVRLRVHFRAEAAVSPYLLLQQEGIKLGSPASAWEEGSFLAAGPGVRARLGRYAVATEELRFRSATAHRFDSKSVLAASNRDEFSIWGDRDGFAEHYGEAVLLSSDEWNLIFAAYERAGRVHARWRGGSVDTHLELLAGADRLARSYNRKVELKPGIRLSQGLGELAPVVCSLFVSYAWQAGFEGETRSGARLLLVVGGQF